MKGTDGMQSWSTFEQRKKEEDHDNGSNVVAAHHTNSGLAALSVSHSSSNIAPTSATLLRHCWLSTPSSYASSKEHGSSNGNGGADDEFRLRFHWMRPHPSLAFALEGDMMAKDNNAVEQKKDNDNAAAAAAVEASKLMDAYRSSQMRKLNLTDDNNDGNKNDKISDIADSNNKVPNNPNLPFELPKLRINLARLVEPPLMSNWLPGEDIDLSYEEVDGDGER